MHFVCIGMNEGNWAILETFFVLMSMGIYNS